MFWSVRVVTWSVRDPGPHLRMSAAVVAPLVRTHTHGLHSERGFACRGALLEDFQVVFFNLRKDPPNYYP